MSEFLSNDQQSILTNPNSRNDCPIHKRHFIKPDGRDIFLYGYNAHDEAPALEMLDGGPKQSELRWHPLRREWAVYAAGRQNRTFKPSMADDPLAPTYADGPPTEIPFTNFELAIFENRFPSFSANPGDIDAGTSGAISGVERTKATGKCEVVVYTPEATGNLSTLGQERRELLVHAWIDRYKDLFEAGAAYVLPFENRGEEVGVTLLHPHGQIYALPIIPKAQSAALDSFAKGYDLGSHMRSWTADYQIAESGGVSAYAPPFARFPYEIWLAPIERKAHLADFSGEELSGFASLLGDITARYDKFFHRETTPYMLSLQAAPNPGRESDAGADNWHFTAQFYPLLRSADKIKYLASVEQATGVFTVDVAPEETARIFRDL